MTARAAHFLLLPELANSPPNEALISAYLESGLQVDLYAPGGPINLVAYGDAVRGFSVEYGYRWLARNLFGRPWFRYRLVSGTTEDPMAVAGLISTMHRIPSVTLADEIKSGSYAGNRGSKWKALCRRGMRGSALTIVNDESRIELQRRYSGSGSDIPTVVYPGAFRKTPFAGNRNQLRAEKGIPDDTLLLAYSGVFTAGNGALWLTSLLKQRHDIHVLGQIVGSGDLVGGLLRSLQGAERMHLEPKRLGWREAWSQASIADIGMVVYLQGAPQFQNMGTSSNRLCMFLAMGVPVIASRQPSFQFIEDYDCGVLVDNEAEFIASIDRIAGRLDEMKANALRCAREYIDALGKYKRLKAEIMKLLVN